ncbi:hypothetical protein C8Q74DRAFT_1233916 [Fomes fomentarius]|nr:hypothetical protein C8Q74DRAFT_1233916 [Fomes fomentarius]
MCHLCCLPGLLLSSPSLTATIGTPYEFTHHRRQMRSSSEPPNLRSIHETYTIILQQLSKPSLRPVRESDTQPRSWVSRKPCNGSRSKALSLPYRKCREASSRTRY